MLTFITVFGLVIGVCIFAACTSAPHCEPVELAKSNDAERAALRREAEAAHRTYHVCAECNAERDREECRRCGDMLAAKLSTPSRRAAR